MVYKAYHVNKLRILDLSLGRTIENLNLCPNCQSTKIENLKKWNDHETLISLERCHNCEAVWVVRCSEEQGEFDED